MVGRPRKVEGRDGVDRYPNFYGIEYPRTAAVVDEFCGFESQRKLLGDLVEDTKLVCKQKRRYSLNALLKGDYDAVWIIREIGQMMIFLRMVSVVSSCDSFGRKWSTVGARVGGSETVTVGFPSQICRYSNTAFVMVSHMRCSS